MNKHEVAKLSTFFSLYIAQSIPMSFFSTVIPVLMRQESFSLTAIGLLQLIKLPWLVKFIWSPYVDRNTSSLKSYKKWIISSELCYAILILTVSLLDLKTNMVTIAVLILASFLASATQDIATDALAVRSFDKKNKSMVNSMQSMGSFAGTLIGSGILLLLFKQMGWNVILPYLAIFVLIALIPLLFLKKKDVFDADLPRPKATKADLLFFFKQTDIWKQIGFLTLCYSGLIGILAMLRPYMVDLGYDIKQIGFMSGVVGTFCGFICSFAGGLIIKKIGRYNSRVLFASIVLISAVYFFIISTSGITTTLLYIGIGLLWGSYGISTVIVYTTAMDNVRKGREGTDFTLQTVITHLSSMLMAVCSGRIAEKLGYQGLFLFEIVLAFIALMYSIYIFKRKKVTTWITKQ